MFKKGGENKKVTGKYLMVKKLGIKCQIIKETFKSKKKIQNFVL